MPQFDVRHCARRLRHDIEVIGVQAVARLREAGRRGPLVLMMPVEGRSGASRLRIWNMAAALRDCGWQAVVVPPRLDLPARSRLIATLSPDVIMMQTARHAANRPSFYSGAPIVVDIDDADFHLDHLRHRVEADLAAADAVIAGSVYVAHAARRFGTPRAEVVWTGTPPSRRSRPPQAGRDKIIAWAQTRPENHKAEAAFVLDVMTRLAGRHDDLVLRLYDRRPDSDPAFAECFRAVGVRVEWLNSMRYRDYLSSFDDVALGFSPVGQGAGFCRGKSFGKLLAYLDRKVPVIASDAADHGLFFRPETGVITNDPAVWAAAADHLLVSAPARQTMADAAHAAFLTRLTTDAAAARVDALLREVVETHPARVAQAMPSCQPIRPLARMRP